MNGSTPHRARATSIASALTVVCVAVAAVVAVRSPGYAGSSVTATTRTVWVTNASTFLLGRINRQIDELDSAAALSSSDFDVLQDGREVFAVDRAAHQLRRIDPATVTLSEPLGLPDHAVVALGGGVLAIGDVATGKVWTRPADHPGTGQITERAPAATVAPGVVLAVGTDGSVAATAPGQDRLTIIGGPTSGDGDQPTRAVPLHRTLSTADGADAAPIAITMVGTRPVVLDRPAGAVIAGDRSWPLPPHASGATLQQSGPKARAVLVATDDALLRISLTDGQVGTAPTGVSGTPAAPVQLNGCAHGAWSGTHPSYLAWCGADISVRRIPHVQGGAAGRSLVFRVNGAEIVLNDIATGDTWLLGEKMTVINNWSQVAPPRADSSQQPDNSGNEDDSHQASLSRTNCSGRSTPPTASPDTFGVRAGHPAIVPVMANDATTDCSAVAIASVAGWDAAVGAVAIVNGGRALQVTPAADASGSLPPLHYRISDGAGRTSQATVQLSVVPDGTHPPPARLRGSATIVGVGGTVTDNVLADWYSPAGDPLWLTAVTAQGHDLTVGFEPGGAITVHDAGTGGVGKRTVSFALTDGVSVEHGTLSVQVVRAADAAPLASPIVATTRAGVPITVRPLDSVLNPGTDPARLTSVTADPVGGRVPAGLAVSTNTDTGTVTVTAADAGSYLLHYQVASGALTSRGVIRIVATDTAPPAPVAVTDIGYLTPDGTRRLDLTANDIAGGAPLAVRQLTVPAGSPLVVTMSDMHIAHISARRPLPPGGSWFSYTASQGSAGATGWVHVIAVQRSADQGPVASAARMTVRVGDAGTLPVSSVAVDRDGAAMTVQAFDPLPAGQGYLFAAGDRIRYLAPKTAPNSSISTVYTVTDTAGRSDSAPLRITVLPRGRNHPPSTPPTAVARVFEGGTVGVRLPLDGIDQDGDWVTATGIVDSGKLGAATVSGPDTITYTALSEPGVDTVTYTASDPSGASVTGRLAVVIVPPPTIARPPVAPDLKVTVAPGKSIGVDVLGAASDPAGLPVSFATGDAAIGIPARSGLSARIRNGLLIVTAGRKPAVAPIGYSIVNSRGLTASGTVTVTISPDVPPVPPTASDVYANSDMLSADHRSVVVDVSGRVSNPGGVPGDLQVGVPSVDQGAARRTGRLRVTIPLTGQRQVIAYRVRNAATLTASAFIVVPPRDTLVPQTAPQRHQQHKPKPEPLLPSVSRLTVDAGKTTTIDIRQYVTGAPAGRSLSMPPDATPTASTGDVHRVDSKHLRWSVPDDAPHQALLHVTVTDGRSTATVAIPATIKPAIPPPPTFQSTAVTVAAGGTMTVTLAPLVTPGRPGQHLTYAGPTGGRHGVRGTLSGSVLTVSAAGTAAKGSTVDLGVTVSDGIHPPVPATVHVTVVASTADLAWVGDVAVPGEQGVTQQINVLAHARNPLPRRGPLTLTRAALVAGDGQVSYAANGTVSITPGPRQVGDLVVRVSVADATGDPDRVVTATVTVTVVGRPGQVTGVAVVATSDRTVDVKWQAPPANGRPIEYYLVRASSGSYQQRCPADSTHCRLTGLTNNVAYRFTVTAHNSVGDSPPSAASAPATPDVAPEAPAAPVLSFGDRSITARWTAPVDRGSPITGYLLTISPAPRAGKPTVLVRRGTRHTFTHLVNGTSYQVTVVAQNSSGTNSDPSAPADMTPAAPPATPAAPGLTYDPDHGAVTVTWGRVAGHGDDAVTYRIAWKGTDGTHGTVTVTPGKPLSATISGATLGVTYSATVTASNKAGRSPASRHGTVRAFTAIGPPGKVSAQPTGADRTVTVSWRAPAYSGWTVSAYQYQIDGHGSWLALPVATSATIHDEALTDGAQHTVAIRACTKQAANACGKGASSGPVVPYGPPGKVTGLAASAGDGEYRLTWTAADGNGRDIAGYQYSIDSGTSWQDTGHGTDTSVTLPGSNGASYTVAVRGYHGKDDGGAAGEQSDPVTVIPFGPPAQVTGLQATAVGDSSFTLSWTAPSGNGRPIAGYQWTKDGGQNWTDTGSTATSKSFTGSNGAHYTIEVRAYHAESVDTYGTKSDPITVTPYGVPDAPPQPSGTGGERSVALSYAAPGFDGGRSISGYQYRVVGQSSWHDAGTSGQVTVGGLSPGSRYQFVVRACNAAGCGSESSASASVFVPYVEVVVVNSGTPTFAEPNTGGANPTQPRLAKGTKVAVQCRDPHDYGMTSVTGGMYHILYAVGYPSAAGRWGAANTFDNGGGQYDPSVPTC